MFSRLKMIMVIRTPFPHRRNVYGVPLKSNTAAGTPQTNKVSKWCLQMNELYFLCTNPKQTNHIKTNRQRKLPVCFDFNVQTRLPAS